jgi:hypothetical protein
MAASKVKAGTIIRSFGSTPRPGAGFVAGSGIVPGHAVLEGAAVERGAPIGSSGAGPAVADGGGGGAQSLAAGCVAPAPIAGVAPAPIAGGALAGVGSGGAGRGAAVASIEPPSGFGQSRNPGPPSVPPAPSPPALAKPAASLPIASGVAVSAGSGHSTSGLSSRSLATSASRSPFRSKHRTRSRAASFVPRLQEMDPSTPSSSASLRRSPMLKHTTMRRHKSLGSYAPGPCPPPVLVTRRAYPRACLSGPPSLVGCRRYSDGERL